MPRRIKADIRELRAQVLPRTISHRIQFSKHYSNHNRNKQLIPNLVIPVLLTLKLQ